jgi:hypothetical protein
MAQSKFFWATLSIGVIWLMVALLGIFGRFQQPEAILVPIAGIALIPTILLVIFGFRGLPPTSGR